MIEKLRRAPWVVAIWTWRIGVRVVMALRVVLIVALARAQTSLRRATGRRPRLLWGPTPMINIKYWSAAMRACSISRRSSRPWTSPIA